MKSISFLALWVLFVSLASANDMVNGQRIIRVPGEYSTIAGAVASSNEGDWIIISPGTYFETEIEINKALTISSEWKISGDESKIDQTIIDAGDLRLFIIGADGVEISGLKIVNGDHTLDIEARVTITHNHFINNLDGMSFESGGGGYVAYNLAENDRDDALDLDIARNGEQGGSDILVEHNTFINSNDDGIEIRLFTYPEQDIHYTIRENQITGSNNAGIQLISYDSYTGKLFHIHHNVITYCKTGLGCMGGAKTREDLSGASKMNETVYFFNNTLAQNDMGATGGNTIIAFNNLVVGNTLGGFKLFGERSIILNNLFFGNGGSDLSDIHGAVQTRENILSADPLLDKNRLYPDKNSPCIDAGRIDVEINGRKAASVSSDRMTGEAPDIGAFEYGLKSEADQRTMMLQVDAGEGRVIESPAARVLLAGRLRGSSDLLPDCDCRWQQEAGPAGAELTNPEQLVTEVSLNQDGIYQFSLHCSDGESTASDKVTIRNINDGDGNEIFLSDEANITIEAEAFAYSYGMVARKKKKFLYLQAGESMNEIAQVEYSLGMAEEKEYDLWLLIKSLSPGKNKISLEFNHGIVGEIQPFNDKKFHWKKVPGKIRATPGQWMLMFRNQEGKAILDRMILSLDPSYIPE